MSQLVSLAQVTTNDLCTDASGDPIPGCFVSDTPLFGDPAPDTGFGSAFGAFFVLAIVASIAAAAWRWHFATKMADRRGIDRREAGLMGMLDERGLAATYVQPVREKPSTPRPSSSPIPAAAPPPVSRSSAVEDTATFPAPDPTSDAVAATRTPNGGVPADAVDDIEARLARLADLEARGVVSADEAAARRAAILEEI